MSRGTTAVIMSRSGIFSKLPQYVLISYFKLNFPYCNSAPFLVPLPSFLMRQIAFYFVHYINTHIYSYFSLKSSWHKAEQVWFLTSSSRVLFWKHFIIFVALHWASLGISLWGNLFQIASLMEENSRSKKKNVRLIQNAHLALQTFRGFAPINKLLWMRSYNMGPKDQEEKIQ